MGVSVGSSIYNAPSIYESGAGGGGGGDTNKIGGRTYRTVTINGVTWLAENLDFKFCLIGGVGNPSTPNAWYYNNNEPTYGIDGVKKCGLLYNWYAVELLNNNRNELIPGWHVPTYDEWNALANAVGGPGVAGTILKSLDGAADGIWPTDWNGTNEFGFSVFPAGEYNSGNFKNLNDYAFFWTSNEIGSSAYYKYFSKVSSIDSTYASKDRGYSIRLVKDQ